MKAGARSSAQTGLSAFEAGDFEKALDYFTRAESLVHATPHLLYIARSRVKLGQLVAAQEVYIQIVRETVPVDASVVLKEALGDAEKELAELEPRIPRITISIEGGKGEPIEVRRGDVVVPAAVVGVEQPIDPGTYTFVAKGDGWTGGPEQVTVTEGQSATVTLKLVPTAKSETVSAPPKDGRVSWTSGKAIGGYVAVGVGIAGLVVGPLLLVQSGSSSDEADQLYVDSGCPGTGCEQTRIEDLDSQSSRQKVIGIVGVSLGAAALVTGVTLLIVNANDKQPESATGLRPWFAGDTVGLQGSF